MTTPVPDQPKIYHIVHVDRLPSIIKDGRIWCDAKMVQRSGTGTSIGMSNIKQRRLLYTLTNYPDLHVGDCAQFYFCPRSVMLYVIYKQNNPDLDSRGGQGPIVHLEADLHQVVAWADARKRRWAFTSSNAGSNYFADYRDLSELDKLNWDAIQANTWVGQKKEGKQAEFLIKQSFPWRMVSRIGVHSAGIRDKCWTKYRWQDISHLLKSSRIGITDQLRRTA